jgi:hypothetical protein
MEVPDPLKKQFDAKRIRKEIRRLRAELRQIFNLPNYPLRSQSLRLKRKVIEE